MTILTDFRHRVAVSLSREVMASRQRHPDTDDPFDFPEESSILFDVSRNITLHPIAASSGENCGDKKLQYCD